MTFFTMGKKQGDIFLLWVKNRVKIAYTELSLGLTVSAFLNKCVIIMPAGINHHHRLIFFQSLIWFLNCAILKLSVLSHPFRFLTVFWCFRCYLAA